MKILKFTTIAERTFEVSFNEDDFFDYMTHCGCPNLKIENQICLYLINFHAPVLADVPFDAIVSVKYNFSKDFRKKFSFINDTLIYNV